MRSENALTSKRIAWCPMNLKENAPLFSETKRFVSGSEGILTMRIKIYQIDPQKDKNHLKYRSYPTASQYGTIDPSIYKCVYHGEIDANSLDDVFVLFNTKTYHRTYQGHSLSVSDVIEMLGEPSTYHFCDSLGWKNIDFNTAQCAEMDGIRVLMIEPGKVPVETRVIDDYRMWQKAVSDHGEPALMEVTHPFDDSVCVIGNEEAKLIGMQGNRRIGHSVYAGPIFLVNEDGHGDFCDMTDEQIEKYAEIFGHPEEISEDEVQADCGYFIISW